MIDQKKWFESIHVSSPNIIMFGIIKNSKLIGVTGLTCIDWKNRILKFQFTLTKKIGKKHQMQKIHY